MHYGNLGLIISYIHVLHYSFHYMVKFSWLCNTPTQHSLYTTLLWKQQVAYLAYPHSQVYPIFCSLVHIDNNTWKQKSGIKCGRPGRILPIESNGKLVFSTVDVGSKLSRLTSFCEWYSVLESTSKLRHCGANLTEYTSRTWSSCMWLSSECDWTSGPLTHKSSQSIQFWPNHPWWIQLAISFNWQTLYQSFNNQVDLWWLNLIQQLTQSSTWLYTVGWVIAIWEWDDIPFPL